MTKKGCGLIVVTLVSLLSALSAFALPQQIAPRGEKVVLVDPNEHAWGAYAPNGQLVRSGLASAGGDWCSDLGRPCHTRIGSFRVRTLGGPGCKSPSFPLPKGGAPMPYCMYFNETQALHGSPKVVHGNISHGCVRMHPSDARWLRNNFVQIGTLVQIQPY